MPFFHMHSAKEVFSIFLFPGQNQDIFGPRILALAVAHYFHMHSAKEVFPNPPFL